MRLIRTVTLLAISVLMPIFALADTTGSVRGFIRSVHPAGQTPLEGATVTVSGRNGIWKTTTDQHGFYVIFGITPGKYEISAFKSNKTQRWVWPQPWPWYGLRYICIHADEDRAVSLSVYRVGPHGFFYAPWVKRNLERQQYQPDGSQTADVYSIGDC